MVWMFPFYPGFTNKHPHAIGPDGLDQAPYRFEESDPPGGSLSPESLHSQPTPLLSHHIQPAPQHVLPTVVSQLIPGLQLANPNNIYNQLRYFKGMPINCPPSSHLSLRGSDCTFRPIARQPEHPWATTAT